MSQEQFDVLKDVMDGEPHSLDLQTYVDSLSAQKGDLSQYQLEDLLRATISLAGSATSHAWPIPDVAEHISKNDDLDLEESVADRFASRLQRILESPVVNLLQVAQRMSASSERVLHGIEVVPKFALAPPQEGGNQPLAAMPTFELVLDYFSASGRDSITIGVDREDLEQLAEAASTGLETWKRLSEFVRSQGILTED